MDYIKVIGTPLYQWESGRKIQIIPLPKMHINTVHFSNFGDAEALVVEPREENGIIVADIPNILLQSGRNIVVYTVNVAEDSVETLVDCTISVRNRAKPADYVYTETEVLSYKEIEGRLATVEEQLETVAEGCSARYRFSSSGWKRILTTIRSINGVITLALGKRGFGNQYQALGIVFAGYVEFAKQKAGCRPTLYQLYNNEFGDSNPSGSARITGVRIGYPKPGTTFPIPNEEGVFENPDNPINCYIDIYVDMDKNVEDHEPPATVFNMHFAGGVLYHNCTIIEEEQDATDVGMYGEELDFYTLTPKTGVDIYIPDGTIEAGNVAGIPLANANTAGLMYLRGTNNTDYAWGIRTAGEDGSIAIARATDKDIDSRQHRYKPIVPYMLEYAVKSVIADVMNSTVKTFKNPPTNADKGDFFGQFGKWYGKRNNISGTSIYMYCGEHHGKHIWKYLEHPTDE